MNAVRRCLVWVVLLVTISSVVAGCNTLKGAGKDIEAGGEAIQDAAD